VLIAAIRDFFFNSNDTKTADSIAQDSLRSIKRKKLELRPHLRLSADDNQFSVDRVLRSPNEPARIAAKPDPKKESHELIVIAAKAAASHIVTITKQLASSRKEEVMQRRLSRKEVLESLGREDGDVVDYIRYFWITTHGPTRANDLFDSIKGEVNSEASAASWVSVLEARSNDYAALLTPSHDAWSTSHQEVRATIDRLRYLGVSQSKQLELSDT
jgi:hypothetical protein